MKAKISMITLGVEDLKAATAFYRDGLELPQFHFASEGVSFFELAGAWLGLYPRNALAEDIAIPMAELTAPGSFTLAHMSAARRRLMPCWSRQSMPVPG